MTLGCKKPLEVKLNHFPLVYILYKSIKIYLINDDLLSFAVSKYIIKVFILYSQWNLYRKRLAWGRLLSFIRLQNFISVINNLIKLGDLELKSQFIFIQSKKKKHIC